jgi:hypothetical protein
MATSGTTTVNFGAFPGSSDTTAVNTGQAAIVAGSLVEAWIWPVATADHSADEHWVESINVVAGNIVAGTGFTIYARDANQLYEQQPDNNRGRLPTGSQPRVYGLFTVAWVWN